MSGRVTWGVSLALFYAAVCATIYFGLFWVIPKALRRRRLRIRVLAILLTLAFSFTIGFFNDKFQNHWRIPKRLLELTVNTDLGHPVEEKEAWNHKTDCFPLYESKPIIQCKVDTSELWLYFTHAFLVGLCIIIIYGVAKDAEDTAQGQCAPEMMEQRLRVYMKLLRFVLYLGAAVLVTEIASVSALLHWPLTYLDTQAESPSKSAHMLVSALLTERAINYTVFLALLYIPAFLIFQEDASRFARLRGPEKSLAEREQWLREKGLSFSSWGYLPRAVAILGPLLSQPILEWLRRFIG
jgi:hypothetical protein